jgi:hypothetical protein
VCHRVHFFLLVTSLGVVRAASGSEQPRSCKGENEKQRIASVGRGRAGRIQRGDGVMKYMLVMRLFQKAIEVPQSTGDIPNCAIRRVTTLCSLMASMKVR